MKLFLKQITTNLRFSVFPSLVNCDSVKYTVSSHPSWGLETFSKKTNKFRLGFSKNKMGIKLAGEGDIF